MRYNSDAQCCIHFIILLLSIFFMYATAFTIQHGFQAVGRSSHSIDSSLTQLSQDLLQSTGDAYIPFHFAISSKNPNPASFNQISPTNNIATPISTLNNMYIKFHSWRVAYINAIDTTCRVYQPGVEIDSSDLNPTNIYTIPCIITQNNTQSITLELPVGNSGNNVWPAVWPSGVDMLYVEINIKFKNNTLPNANQSLHPFGCVSIWYTTTDESIIYVGYPTTPTSAGWFNTYDLVCLDIENTGVLGQSQKQYHSRINYAQLQINKASDCNSTITQLSNIMQQAHGFAMTQQPPGAVEQIELLLKRQSWCMKTTANKYIARAGFISILSGNQEDDDSDDVVDLSTFSQSVNTQFGVIANSATITKTDLTWWVDTTHTTLHETYTDGIIQPWESDVDCGGFTGGLLCDSGKQCRANSDCLTLRCGTDNKCEGFDTSIGWWPVVQAGGWLGDLWRWIFG